MLVLADAPRGAGGAELERALIRRAARWAAEVGEAWIAVAPERAEDEVRPLVPATARLVAQRGAEHGERIAAAVDEVLEGGERPLLIAGTREPRLGRAHAEAALSDLAAGCDLVFGPALTGGFYLVGITRARPELFALPSDAWGTPRVMEGMLDAARAEALEVGLLRPERGLVTAADARAARLDPLTPPEIAALLG